MVIFNQFSKPFWVNFEKSIPANTSITKCQIELKKYNAKFKITTAPRKIEGFVEFESQEDLIAFMLKFS